MFDRFTDPARKVMALARRESQRLNHDFIGTEHILLGLIQEGSGGAARVLKNLGVESEKIRPEIEKNVQPGPSMVTMGQLPFTPQAKKVLELSMEEANELGHNYIGTEHLLLGLVRGGEGVAAKILAEVGLRLEETRAEVGALPDPEGLPPPGREVQFDRFTDRARKVMALARKEAQRLCHDYIGTEHILLGLILEGRGVAARVLAAMGVQPDVVRREVEKNVQTGPSMVTMGQLPFTPRVKRALELAMAEAMDLRHNYIGTEHLLLGLIKERDGVAAQVLRDLGCELEKARALVGEIAGQSPEPSSGPRGIPLSEVRELLQSYLHRHGARADLKSGPPVIQATEFELVDADDRVRARLGFDENGEPRLELLDEDGNVTGRFPEKPGT